MQTAPKYWDDDDDFVISVISLYICIYNIYIIHIIRRPRPSPRQGRRLGPPEVWNLLCHGHGLHVVQGFHQALLPPSPLAVSLCSSRVAACPLPAQSPLLLGRSSLPFASLQTLKPSVGAFVQTLPTLKPSRSLAAASTKPSGRQPLLFQGCSPLPAHSPLLLGRSSLPFASLQTLKTLGWGVRLPGFKHLKVLKPSRSLAAASTKPSGRQPLLFQGCSLPFACT